MTSLFDPQAIAQSVPPNVLFAILGNPSATEKEKAKQLINYLADHGNEQVRPVARNLQHAPDAVFDTLLVLGQNSTTTAPATADRQEGSVACVVCSERLPAVMLWPCRHVVYCFECARTSRERLGATSRFLCPLCREPVGEFVDVKLP